MKQSQLKIVFAAAVLMGLAGCSNTSALDALRGDIQKAQSTADGAASDAKAARADAANASQTAADAKATADEAKAMAQDTDARIDRMFKKAMHK